MDILGIYRGFLGSEGTRFPGQDTVDIQFSHWRDDNNVVPVRQRATAVAQGVTFLSPEDRVEVENEIAGEPPELVWEPCPQQLANMIIVNHGPSRPNLAHIPHVCCCSFSHEI